MGVIAFIGLGANLGDAKAGVLEAIRQLGAETSSARVRRIAPLYRTDPIGPPGQPDFENTVAEIDTVLKPRALLAFAKAIEQRMGRKPGIRWGPRIIDLDILIYGDQILRELDLVIPHPEITRRRFVLQPLFDLAPDLVVPGTTRTVRALLASLDDDPKGVRLDA